MKAFAVFLAVGMGLGLLAGCSSGSRDTEKNREYYGSQIVEVQKKLDDGRTVECIIFISGGISCDWNSATAGDVDNP